MSQDDKSVLLREIKFAVRKDVDALLQSKFFSMLKLGGIDRNGLCKFALEYGFASNGFPQLLAQACSKMPSDELRLPFVANLWDEHGIGNLNRSHRAMYASFLAHLNLVLDGASHGPSENYLGSMKLLCSGAGPVKLLGIFGPGLESFTPREYRVIVDFLRSSFELPDESIAFFLDHIGHDHEHIDLIDKALLSSLQTSRDVRDAIDGAKESIAIETVFWDEMHEYCCN
jgi:Iron-containing redox enzyme